MKPMQFVAEVRRELAKVTWPTRTEVVKMTSLVIVISCVVGLYIGAIDLALTRVMSLVIQ